jgi:hypothetical protein
MPGMGFISGIALVNDGLTRILVADEHTLLGNMTDPVTLLGVGSQSFSSRT